MPERPRWTTVGPGLALLVAVGAAVVLTRSDDGAAPAGPAEPAAIEVTSDAPRRTTLEALLAASDLVVRADVVRTTRGRMFGDPGTDAAIESRLVTLDVAAVLAGTLPGGADTLLVEEEGWTADGAPLVVDGAAASREGDDGIWFLVEVEGPEGPGHVVVSAQGRYVVDGTSLRGASGDDPLVHELAGLTLDELTTAITALR